MPKYYNDHVRAFGDEPETLNLDEVGDLEETLYQMREDSEACPYISDNFKDKLQRLISIGGINTGCDNGWGQLWIDTESGKITAQDGRDEINIALDVCNSRDDVIKLWERYVKLCEKPEFLAACPAFVDMLVWDRTMCYDEHAIEADALWHEARTGLRNVGDYHNHQYMAECRCEEGIGCWKPCSEDEQEGMS